MQQDKQTVAVLRDARDEVVPSRERFDAMFTALMAGKTPLQETRMPKIGVSPFGQISGILNTNIRDFRITAHRTTKGITLMFDYAHITTPKNIAKLATRAWKVCVKHLD